MINRTVGFIGGGRITGVILDGLKRAGALPAAIVVSDPATDVLAKLKERHPGITVTHDNALAASQEVAFGDRLRDRMRDNATQQPKLRVVQNGG